MRRAKSWQLCLDRDWVWWKINRLLLSGSWMRQTMRRAEIINKQTISWKHKWNFHVASRAEKRLCVASYHASWLNRNWLSISFCVSCVCRWNDLKGLFRRQIVQESLSTTSWFWQISSRGECVTIRTENCKPNFTFLLRGSWVERTQKCRKQRRRWNFFLSLDETIFCLAKKL